MEVESEFEGQNRFASTFNQGLTMIKTFCYFSKSLDEVTRSS